MLITILLQASPPPGGGMPMTLLFLVAFIGIFYFFMIRPQTKKANEQKKFIGEIKKGDKVVTIGGIHGKVAKVDDDTFLVDVDANTKLRIEKSTISIEFTKAANAKATAGTEKDNGKV